MVIKSKELNVDQLVFYINDDNKQLPILGYLIPIKKHDKLIKLKICESS